MAVAEDSGIDKEEGKHGVDAVLNRLSKYPCDVDMPHAQAVSE